VTFIGEASPEAMPLAERFACWQPLYAAIGAADLDDYLLFLARRTLDEVRSLPMLRDCWLGLTGCESVAITEQLARAAVDRLVDIGERQSKDDLEERLTRWVMRYLSDLGTADPVPPPPDWHGERYYVWQWLITAFCRWLLQTCGMHAAAVLEQRHWFGDARAAIGRQQRFAMKRGANLAFGSWYRHDASHAERDEYAQMVEDLMRGNDFQRRSRAYFLIRHTARAERGRRVVVDRRFAPLLKTLAADARLARDLARFPTVAVTDDEEAEGDPPLTT
jgi:hypothetical protein